MSLFLRFPPQRVSASSYIVILLYYSSDASADRGFNGVAGISGDISSTVSSAARIASSTSPIQEHRHVLLCLYERRAEAAQVPEKAGNCDHHRGCSSLHLLYVHWPKTRRRDRANELSSSIGYCRNPCCFHLPSKTRG